MAYPSSRMTLGLGVRRCADASLMRVTSATKMSHALIFLKMASVMLGLPGTFFVSRSMTGSTLRSSATAWQLLRVLLGSGRGSCCWAGQTASCRR